MDGFFDTNETMKTIAKQDVGYIDPDSAEGHAITDIMDAMGLPFTSDYFEAILYGVVIGKVLGKQEIAG